MIASLFHRSDALDSRSYLEIPRCDLLPLRIVRTAKKGPFPSIYCSILVFCYVWQEMIVIHTAPKHHFPPFTLGGTRMLRPWRGRTLSRVESYCAFRSSPRRNIMFFLSVHNTSSNICNRASIQKLACMDEYHTQCQECCYEETTRSEIQFPISARDRR